jgi:arsenate reductase
MEFIEYPKCSTCKKAKKYLEENKQEFIDRDITNNTPTEEELSKYLSLTPDKNINKFFNTSGLIYKKLNLKYKIKTMTESEKITLLSQNGMLIKRPLLVGVDFIIIGFKEDKYNEILRKKEL